MNTPAGARLTMANSRNQQHGPSDPATAPWHRHPMVWLIIAIPGSAVVMGVVLLSLAIGTPESVVRDDYYQAGRTINIDLRDSYRAADLGVVAEFRGSPEDGWSIQVRKERGTGGGRPAPVDVLLAHPTLASRDLEFSLDGLADGSWDGALPPLAGRRMLTLRPRDGDWLLREEIDLAQLDHGVIEVRARPLGDVR